MEYYAILLLILILLSACIQPSEQPPANEGDLGISGNGEPALDELPAGSADQNNSLLGQPVDLGSII
jgi:hypothetical protein